MEDNIKGKVVARRHGVEQARNLNNGSTLDAIKYIKQIQSRYMIQKSAEFCLTREGHTTFIRNKNVRSVCGTGTVENGGDISCEVLADALHPF